MSFYCVVAQHDTETFNNYLLPGLQKWGVDTAISMNSDPNVEESIFRKYNDGILSLINDSVAPLKDEDIVCFCHEDVKIIDPNFIPKVELVFAQREDVGLCGVVGATELSESGAWWQNPPDKLRGHIIQENGTTQTHLLKGAVGFFDDLVAIDGLCFFIRGSLLLNNLHFDTETYDGFHFYDIDICMSVLQMGFKVACVDILVQHKSIGDITKNKDWYGQRDKFVTKCKTNGVTFPITTKSFISNNIQTVEV